MRSWISPSRFTIRPRQLANLFVGSLLWLALTGGGQKTLAASWEWFPWLSLATGYESDLILDPDLERSSVPGGNFLDIIPAVALAGRLGDHTSLRFSGQAIYERFFNEENRSLLSTLLTGDLLIRPGGPWQWRSTLGASYFTDSERESVDRFTGGFETFFGLSRSRWRLELLGGVQGRQYPNLFIANSTGGFDTYKEGTLSLGITGAVQPITGLVVYGTVRRQGTDSRDPLYDAKSWTIQGSAQLELVRHIWLTLTGLSQSRHFTSRLPPEDTDSYWQFGTALEYDLSENVSLAARFALANYTQPDGFDEQTHRLSLAFIWRFGQPALSSIQLAFPTPVDIEPASFRENEPYLFRFHAPNSEQVAWVSDINGWDPTAHSMQPAGDGWWEVEIRLPAGSHQYAYWVDGRLVTPPEAQISVDDGFGGRNGLIEVLPAGM